MIVDDLYGLRALVGPREADTPLIIDPNAVLASPIFLQSFETIARRRPKIVERARGIEHVELACGDPVDILPTCRRQNTVSEETVRLSIRVASNHNFYALRNA